MTITAYAIFHLPNDFLLAYQYKTYVSSSFFLLFVVATVSSITHQLSALHTFRIRIAACSDAVVIVAVAFARRRPRFGGGHRHEICWFNLHLYFKNLARLVLFVYERSNQRCLRFICCSSPFFTLPLFTFNYLL